jgi:HTH-type transcriptional regulator/antitoxin HigA
MIKRGWIQAENVRDVSVVEAELVKFFGVSSSEEIQILPHAAKKTDAFSETTLVQLAWLHRVRTIACEMLVPKYSPSNIKAVLAQLKAILPAPEETRKIPRILAECGIRFVIVECLPSAKIDGACLWLDDASPVIGMSLRHDRIDNFWFVLRHELEHVICQHGKVSPILDTSLEGERTGTGDGIPEEERVANSAASEFCVSKKLMDGFIARKSPYFAERDILGFAKTIGVHPGLIAGQLQYRTNRYDRFRSHLVKVRSFVTPSAMVDGWGDVAPVGI